MFARYDLIMLGMILVFGGLLFFAKAYRRQSARFSSVDHHTFSKMYADISRHSHTMAGVRWITIGAVALSFGVTRNDSDTFLFDPWIDTALHMTVFSVAWGATLMRTNRISRQTYQTRMNESHQLRCERSNGRSVHGCEEGKSTASPQ